jgi:hypothetical protein
MKKLSSFSLCLGVILLASFGCSSNKPAGGGSSQMSVAITTQPATSVQVNKTSTVTATVTNDSSNAGVDWTLWPAAGAVVGPSRRIPLVPPPPSQPRRQCRRQLW